MVCTGAPRHDGSLPFFVAAGVIKTKEQIKEFADLPGVRAEVLGTYTEPKWFGNDPSGTKRATYWDEASQTFYNAVGLKNLGRKEVSAYLPEGIKRIQAAGKLAIMAVASLKHEDARVVMPNLAEWGLEMGADGIELTLSCPNLGRAPVLCLDVEKSLQTVVATRERIGNNVHLQAKVSPLSPSIIEQYANSSDFFVNAVASINTCLRKTDLIEVNDGWAGESGPVVTERARHNLEEWVAQTDGLLDIWSVGGIDSGYEAYERVADLGAKMVGGAQAFYRAEDPALVAQRWVQEYKEAATGKKS